MSNFLEPEQPKTAALVVNTIPHRFDFPPLYVPVMSRVANSGAILSGAIDPHVLRRNIGIDGVNVDWQVEGELFVGPTVNFTTPTDEFPEVVGYSRIVGIDQTHLFICTDAYMGFYPPKDGFVMTSAFAQTYPEIEREVVSKGYGRSEFKLDAAFDVGTAMMRRYPMRKGSWLKAYGVKDFRGPGFVGVLVLEPPKRDTDSCFVKTFTSTSRELLEADMLEYVLSVDISGDRFSMKYKSVIEVEEETITVGFLVVAAHLVSFGYKSMAALVGVSKEHVHHEGAKELLGNARHEITRL